MQTVGTSSNDLATKTTDNNSQSGDSGDDETNGMMTQETRTTPRRYSTPYRCERRGVLLIWAILDGVHLMSASLVSQAILNCIRKKWGEPSAQVKMLENNANASLTARRHQLLFFFLIDIQNASCQRKHRIEPYMFVKSQAWFIFMINTLQKIH